MNLEDYQSGYYKQQYEYQSFCPTPINHPWVITDTRVQRLLSDADRLLGELNAFSQLVPDVDFFIRMHITKEATQSSRIEGTRTNIEEALLGEQDIEPEKRGDWEEVQNHIQSINLSIKQLNEIPLSNRLLRNAHRTLMQGVRGETKQPGEFRISQNWIGVSLGNAMFVPPHWEEVPDLMGDLEQFIHNDHMNVPHLVRIAIAHYQFETVHPFLDGNGRLGRLMIALYLANFGLLEKPSLYLSDFFERNKTDYISHLMAVREGNKMSEWILFFLHGVQETATNSIRVFKNILLLKSEIESKHLPHFTNRRQANAQALLNHLYQVPLVSVKGVAKLLDVQINTASALINDFKKHGILVEITGNQRNRLFGFRDYIQIFKDT